MTDRHLGFDEDEYRATDNKRLEEIRANIHVTFTGSPQGEFTLAWLYDIVAMGKTSFVPGQADFTAYKEGRRSVLLDIMGVLKINEEEIFRRARAVTRNLEKQNYE